MLIHTISLTLYKTLNVIIHNQYLNIELISPVYFCNHGTYYEYPSKKTNDNVMMKTSFRFDPKQDKPGGILMYEIQRKEREISGPQSSVDTTYTNIIKETSKMIRLLVTWRIQNLKEPKVYITLIRHDDESILNEDKLVQLYKNTDAMSSSPCGYTWLVGDNALLNVEYKYMRKEDRELEITISEEFSHFHATKPRWIDPER
jgi:hypothetical protein